MRSPQPHKGGGAPMIGPSPHISVWKRSGSTLLSPAITPGLAFVITIAAEFRRATAATVRYKQLRRTAGDSPGASPARQVYIEFYSGR
jgi:hypothetical protein